MLPEDLFLTVFNTNRKYISNSINTIWQKKSKFLRNIFRFNILKWKWLRLQKQMIQIYAVHTFCEVGIISLRVSLSEGENDFPGDFLGFSESVWTRLYENLEFKSNLS